jgi:hypothetical protein
MTQARASDTGLLQIEMSHRVRLYITALNQISSLSGQKNSGQQQIDPVAPVSRQFV